MMINKICGSNLLTSSKLDCASKEGNTEKLAVVPLQSQYVEDTARVLVKSFLGINSLYQNLDMDHDKFIAYMRNKCQNAVNNMNKYNNYPTSWVLLRDGTVVGASIMSDLIMYIKNLKNNHSGIKTYDAYLQSNQQFWNELDLTPYKEGEVAYADMFGVNPEDENKGYALMLTDRAFADGLKKRKYLISRITHQKMLQLLIKHRQAKVLKEFNYVASGANNIVWMIEINYQKIRNSAKVNEKSKL